MQTVTATVAQMGIRDYGDLTRIVPIPAELEPPAADQARVRHTVIGVNYADIYFRRGRYRLPSLPAVLGLEAAGVVEAVGAAVSDIAPGQRVAYAGLPAGSYATQRNVAADRLIPLPDDVADDTVAAMLLRGITAHMLLTGVRRVGEGDTLLIHAVAGGLGLVLAQWAKALGATVLGTVGGADKAESARAHGVDVAILYREHDFVEAVLDATDGRGADLVIDGIGGDTLRRSLMAARPFGLVASIGQVDGDAPDIDLRTLDTVPGVALCRPSVMRYMQDASVYRAGAMAAIERIQSGLTPHIDSAFPLAEAAEAHRRLESGRSTGAVILYP